MKIVDKKSVQAAKSAMQEKLKQQRKLLESIGKTLSEIKCKKLSAEQYAEAFSTVIKTREAFRLNHEELIKNLDASDDYFVNKSAESYMELAQECVKRVMWGVQNPGQVQPEEVEPSEEASEVSAEESAATEKLKSLEKKVELLTAIITKTKEFPGDKKDDLKMGKYVMTKFDGEISNWRSFKASLQILLDATNTSGKNKFQLLKEALSGEPLDLIKNLNCDEGAMKSAVEILYQRFENKRVLLNYEFERILSLGTLGDDVKSLKKVFDRITNLMLNGLELCKEEGEDEEEATRLESNMLHFLIVRVVERQLHSTTIMEFENFKENKNLHLATVADMREYLHTRFQKLENLEHGGKQKPEASKTAAAAATPTPTKAVNTMAANQCQVCNNGSHSIRSCPKFQRATPKERMKQTKTVGLCFNCLGHKHSTERKCSKPAGCHTCKGYHDTLLHFPRKTESIAKVNMTAIRGSVVLPTAVVTVLTANSTEETARALVDSGSHVSIVSERLVEILGLKTVQAKTKMVSITGKVVGVSNKLTTVRMQLRDGQIMTFAAVVAELPYEGQALEWDEAECEQLQQFDLADEDYYTDGRPIDLLLGAAEDAVIACPGISRVGGLIVRNSMLGGLVSGAAKNKWETTSIEIPEAAPEEEFVQTTNAMEWEYEEELDENDEDDYDDVFCDKLFKETTYRDDEKYVNVRIPFKPDKELGDTRRRALSRLLANEKKLAQNPAFKEAYLAYFQEMIDQGILSEVMGSSDAKSFLAHHGVIQEKPEGLKIRPVMDASMKSSNGKSLNDLVYIGRKLYTSIFKILLGFQKYKCAVAGDLRKMFLQVRVDKEDKKWLRVLFRFDSTGPIREFQFNTLIFGLACSPFLAIRAVQFAAKDCETSMALVNRNFYCDDLMVSYKEESEAENNMKILANTLQESHFVLTQWASSSASLRSKLKGTEEEKAIDSKTEEVGALGVKWDQQADDFIITVKPMWELKEGKRPSRRILASDTAKCWDPLGWLAATMIIAKLLLQEICSTTTSWDEEIGEATYKEWKVFADELMLLNGMRKPRWVGVTDDRQIELVVCCDASMKAMAAVIYCRVLHQEGIRVTMLAAKTKVAPLGKKMTIPRLELGAMTIAAELVTSTLEAFGLDKMTTKVVAYSDSQPALGWVKGSPFRRKVYVANRVIAIQDQVPAGRWRYINTKENPADDFSRGITPAELKAKEDYWTGPAWLAAAELPDETISYETTEETKPNEDEAEVLITSVNTMIEEDFTERFSSYERLLRTTARMRSWKTKQRGPIKAQHVREAEICIIKYVQSQHFAEEIRQVKAGQVTKQDFAVLVPFIDKQGLMRVTGRLENGPFDYDRKHPIIVPAMTKRGESKGYVNFTKLLIENAHQQVRHLGTNATLANLRQRFYIFGATTAVKKILKGCMSCFMQQPTHSKQQMGNLPASRVTPNDAFAVCGLDYAGPIQMRTELSRGTRHYKGYIALFVCFATKALHLEAVSGYTARDFIHALQRFIARRGLCRTIHCDNGTNFVGANRILKAQWQQAVEVADSEYGLDLRTRKIDFVFCPPRQPHMNGLAEAGVKAAKKTLMKTTGPQVLTFEEMATVLAQNEAVLNARPLYAVSNRPDDFNYLTPAHFLIGRALDVIPEISMKGVKPTQRYELVHQSQEAFWQLYESEHVHQLQKRFKWQKASKNLEVGQLILVISKDAPRNEWHRGRIRRVETGTDGLVRVVHYETASGKQKKKHVNDVCVLPTDDNEVIGSEAMKASTTNMKRSARTSDLTALDTDRGTQKTRRSKRRAAKLALEAAEAAKARDESPQPRRSTRIKARGGGLVKKAFAILLSAIMIASAFSNSAGSSSKGGATKIMTFEKSGLLLTHLNTLHIYGGHLNVRLETHVNPDGDIHNLEKIRDELRHLCTYIGDRKSTTSNCWPLLSALDRRVDYAKNVVATAKEDAMLGGPRSKRFIMQASMYLLMGHAYVAAVYQHRPALGWLIDYLYRGRTEEEMKRELESFLANRLEFEKATNLKLMVDAVARRIRMVVENSIKGRLEMDEMIGSDITEINMYINIVSTSALQAIETIMKLYQEIEQPKFSALELGDLRKQMQAKVPLDMKLLDIKTTQLLSTGTRSVTLENGSLILNYQVPLVQVNSYEEFRIAAIPDDKGNILEVKKEVMAINQKLHRYFFVERDYVRAAINKNEAIIRIAQTNQISRAREDCIAATVLEKIEPPICAMYKLPKKYNIWRQVAANRYVFYTSEKNPGYIICGGNRKLITQSRGLVDLGDGCAVETKTTVMQALENDLFEYKHSYVVPVAQVYNQSNIATGEDDTEPSEKVHKEEKTSHKTIVVVFLTTQAVILMFGLWFVTRERFAPAPQSQRSEMELEEVAINPHGVINPQVAVNVVTGSGNVATSGSSNDSEKIDWKAVAQKSKVGVNDDLA